MAKKKKGKMGRPIKHGGCSIELKDELLQKHLGARTYLRETRSGLIRDVAGSEQQRLLIDRIISKLLILRVIEIYVEKHGIWRGDKLKRYQGLELEPALGLNYLAFSKSVDRALKLLGIHKQAKDMKAVYLEDL